MKKIMKKCVLPFLFLLGIGFSFGQVTLYTEDFTGQNGKGAVGPTPTTDLTGVDWTIDISSVTLSATSDWFRVTNEVFEARDIDGNAIWYSPSINIATYTNVSFSLDAVEAGTMESADIFNTEYRINGASGTWTTATTNGSLNDDFTSASVSQIGLSGNTLELRVTMNNNSGTEYHRLDNILVEGTMTSTDTTVTLANATSTIAEDGSTIDVCVSITNEDATNATTVDLNVDVASTAINGTDYTTVMYPVTLTFPAGSNADQCVTFTITDDGDVETDETIVLNLQNATGGNNAILGTTTQHTLTITDNDAIVISAGDIIITEIMQNPSAVSDANGEYFEVYNTTSNSIDMNGWIIKDDDTNTHTINSSVIVASNDYVIFGRNGDFATNGGIIVDYDYSSSTWELANSADEVVLMNGATEIDAVKYDGGTAFPDPTGASMNLRTTKYDVLLNDAGDSWCDSVSAFGDGDLGTPGTTNDVCACLDQPTVTYTAGAWDNAGVGPTITDNAVIDDDFTLTPTNSFDSCSCTVNATKTLTISADSYFKANYDITNNGTIIVENTGSIVQINDDAMVTGTDFQIQKTTTSYVEYDFTYWSSPIETADIATVFSASQADRIYDFTTANFDDANANTFDDNNDDWAVASGTMTKGKGYIVEGEGADWPFDSTNIATGLTQNVSFDGKINNGIVDYAVTLDANALDAFDNQNLIGNPYPSAIDIKKLQAQNSAFLSGTYYFWTHGTEIASGTAGSDTDAYNFTNADYATATTDGTTFNSTASTGTVGKSAPEFIASGQGFFVDATAAGTVTFNNDMRVTGDNNEFRNATTVHDRVWLNMTNENGMFRQILVGFFNNATDAHDNGIDGKRLLNGDEFDFYSLMNSTKYAIQGFSTLVNEKTVPLGIEAPHTGTLTLSIDHLEGDLANVNIYLKDNLLNSFHDLKRAAFNLDITQIGEVNDRYELFFSRNALAVSNEVVSVSDLIVANSNNEIHFEMRNGININNVQIFDIIGKLVIQANPKSNNFNLHTNVENGTVLFIKVQLENGQTLTNKFIKL